MASWISKRIIVGSVIFMYFMLALSGCGGSSGGTTYPFSELNTGDGLGVLASFSSPDGITTDNTYLYVADSINNTIRKVQISNGFVTTLAGKLGVLGGSDGVGGAALFANPLGILAFGQNLFVADSTNNYIRQVLISNGTVSTLVNISGKLSNPQGIATDGTTLYVADTSNHVIRTVNISTGVVSTLAGTIGQAGFIDGPGLSTALLDAPEGVAIVGRMLYVTDTDNNAVRQINIDTGVVSTLAGTAGPVDSNTGLPTSGIAGTSDSTDGTGATAQFDAPSGLTTDGTSNLYLTDTSSHTIRAVAIATGAVTTLAGTAGTSGSTNGTGAAALFNVPSGITYAEGNLYVADTGNSLIRTLAIVSRKVTTLAGGGLAP